MAETMADWPEWQKPYRFGVLLVLPPEPVRMDINALRAIYDPVSHEITEAHISLTVPFPAAPDERAWQELERAASGFGPLSISYGPLVPFLPKPGAALQIEPQAELDRLRRALEACRIFQGADPRRYPFWAHMTIAEFISVSDTEKLVKDIGGERAPSGSFVCEYLSHLVPDESFRFSEHRRLALGT
jgi:2'-5' RNA ligase